MGDILHALPAITALRAAHPGWFLGWAVEPSWRALLCAESKPDDFGRGLRMPLVDRVHRVNTKRWGHYPLSGSTISEIRRVRRSLRAQKYDVCLVLQGTVRSGLIALGTRAPRRIGEMQPRERLARWFFNEEVATTTPHVIEHAIELAGAIAHEKLPVVNPSLPRDEFAEAWCEELFAGDVAGPVVLLNPGAGWGAKRWPVERYGSVARSLADRGYTVIVNAGPGEEELAAELVRTSGGAASFVECNVGQLISLTRRAALVIAGDTGPLHLANALGKPVVGIYGPTDPARNGPFHGKFRVLRHPDSKRDHTRRPEPEAGLLTITPEAVLQAAVELLTEETGS